MWQTLIIFPQVSPTNLPEYNMINNTQTNKDQVAKTFTVNSLWWCTEKKTQNYHFETTDQTICN